MTKTVKLTKRALVIEIMKANATDDMIPVIKLIAAGIGVDKYRARAYYRSMVMSGAAPGKIVPLSHTEAGSRKAKPKAAKVKTKEVSAEKLLKSVGVKPEASTRSIDEIKEIKAKNLKKLREVSQVSQTISKAREELMGYDTELDEFLKTDQMPEFLRIGNESR